MSIRSPEEEYIQRDCSMGDLTDEHIMDWAQRRGNAQIMRLFREDAHSCIRPESLKAQYSVDELGTLSEKELHDGLNEIQNLIGPVLGNYMPYLRQTFTPPGFKPFDLSLSCSHIGNPGEEAVESTPANIVELHNEKFSMDLSTLAMIEYIKRTAENPTIAASTNALQLEILGHFEFIIKELNGILAGFYKRGYSSKIVRPTLSMALQSAIQRQSSLTATMLTETITNERGPGGRLLAVISAAGTPIRIIEGTEEFKPGVGNLQTPRNHYLVRELRL